MTARALRMIYREIPSTSPCKVGCGGCCGPVPWAPDEFNAVASDIPVNTKAERAMGKLILSNAATGKCPFLGPQGCGVYDRRPLVCRLYGAVKDEPKLTCPEGVKANRPLSGRQAAALTARYIRETER